LKEKIEGYLKLEDGKQDLPNFIENEERARTITFLRQLLPTLRDDDYFLDKRDSLVYNYLMDDEKV
jgi:hypothetical protein